MSEMVMRMAKALFDYDLHHSVGGMGLSTTLDDLLPEYRDRYLAKARAAIEAMREPTETMREDGYAAACCHDYGKQFPNLEISPATWRAMIDAALKE